MPGIRTTRLEIPLDENDVPIFSAVGGSSTVAGRIRSTRLDWPLDENEIPLVNVQVLGGVGTATGSIRFGLAPLPGEIEVNEKVNFSKTNDAELLAWLLATCPDVYDDRGDYFGFKNL